MKGVDKYAAGIVEKVQEWVNSSEFLPKVLATAVKICHKDHLQMKFEFQKATILA
jgi:hypothetical protein